jgi:hypothetical protein
MHPYIIHEFPFNNQAHTSPFEDFYILFVHGVPDRDCGFPPA